MPSSLTLCVNEVIQRINDLTVAFPIRWNRGPQRWIHQSNLNQRYYGMIFTIIVAGWLPVNIYLHIVHHYCPELFDAQQVIITALSTVVAISSVMFQIILFKHACQGGKHGLGN